MEEKTLFWVGYFLSVVGIVPLALAEMKIVGRGEVKTVKDVFVHFAFLFTFACSLTTAPAVLIGCIIYAFGDPSTYSWGLITAGISLSVMSIIGSVSPFWLMFQRSKLKELPA